MEAYLLSLFSFQRGKGGVFIRGFDSPNEGVEDDDDDNVDDIVPVSEEDIGDCCLR